MSRPFRFISISKLFLLSFDCGLESKSNCLQWNANHVSYFVTFQEKMQNERGNDSEITFIYIPVVESLVDEIVFERRFSF